MAICSVFNTLAEKVSEIELNDEIFSIDVKTDILHDVVCMQRANRRGGNACTKNRGAVSGGGAKPWRQKGTGRARSGSRTSPIWRGGGTINGPKPRSYSYALPKKIRKLALKMALSARQQEGNLVIIDQIDFPEIKTKKFLQIMRSFEFNNCLLITPEFDEKINLSSRNSVGFKALPVVGLNVIDILKHSKLMLIQASLEKLNERLVI